MRMLDKPMRSRMALALLACLCGGCSPAGGVVENVLTFRGASDASAGVAVTNELFVVADDENNELRVYKTAEGGLLVFTYDLAAFLEVEPNHPEADIEGATRIGDRIYWITSHGRNKDGEDRPGRYRFFATDITVREGAVNIHPVGRPCKTLMHQLLQNKSARNLGLDKATRFGEDLGKKDLEKLAPKNHGLNIEGLCSSADGDTIYIGFRNPRPATGTKEIPHALIVPLKNPASVVESGAAPVFGEPILWDLGGSGIRSMEYSDFHKAYFIIAGRYDEDGRFALYSWSGKTTELARFVRRVFPDDSTFTSEAIIPFAGSSKLLLLSDDGTIGVKVHDKSECAEGELLPNGFCPNKFLTDSNKKTFRAAWLEP